MTECLLLLQACRTLIHAPVDPRTGTCHYCHALIQPQPGRDVARRPHHPTCPWVEVWGRLEQHLATS